VGVFLWVCEYVCGFCNMCVCVRVRVVVCMYGFCNVWGFLVIYALVIYCVLYCLYCAFCIFRFCIFIPVLSVLV